jgi:AhpD family alkylhydroperoxidase
VERKKIARSCPNLLLWFVITRGPKAPARLRTIEAGKKEIAMQARMKNPVLTVPNAMQSALALGDAIKKGVDGELLTLIHLRASQINGCSFCVDMHARELKEAGENDARLWSIAAWRESPLFSDAERAVLQLTESATRIADGGEVPDAIWNDAAKHFDEKALGAIVLNIAMINFWNRVNVMVRQVAGARG